jgi:hypothetical protein
MELHFDYLASKGFSPFKGQFIINQHRIYRLSNFEVKKIKAWNIQIHETLTALNIINAVTRENIGLVFGYNIPIPIKRKKQCIEITLASYDKINQLLFHLNQSLNGRYLGIISFKQDEYIFNDYSASMCCLYNTDTGVLSSSIWIQEKLELRQKPTKLLDGVRQQKFQYLQRSPYSLLPPHSYVNLQTGAIKRYSLDLLPEIDKITPDAVYFLFKRDVELIIDSNNLNLLLSGGLDSRLLLSCLMKNKSNFITSSFYDSKVENQNTIDNRIASALATLCDLHHTSIDLSIDKNITVSQNYVALVGYGGELARGYLQNKSGGSLEVKALLQILGLPSSNFYINLLNNWLNEINVSRPNQILDQLYLDFFIAHLNSPSLYQYDITSKYSYAPFISNDFVKLFLSTVNEETKLDDLFIRIIGQLFPKLLDLSFSS